MTSEFEVLTAASPYPIVTESELRNGYSHKAPSVCQHCESKPCLAANDRRFLHQVCEFGLSFYPIDEFGETASICGLIVTNLNHKVGGERRKALKYNWVHNDTVQSFYEALKKISVAVDSYGVLQKRTSLSVLHEIRTSVGVVLSSCEKLVQDAPGTGTSEKIENADPLLKNLFHSISLLKEQLELTDVIANPESITYGQKHQSDLNGMFFKMVKLFEPRAAKRNIQIKFSGMDNVKVRAYNSFQLVPLILLDNAIKYSYRNRKIYVEIRGSHSDTIVRVSSYGDLVPEESRERIFDKFVRGENATAQAVEGMGLGLFVARQISEAHGFTLSYEPGSSGGRTGNNEFALRIPIP